MHVQTSLSLEIKPHPQVAKYDDASSRIEGSLALAGALTVVRDLNAGDDLTVQVCDADGQVIASGKFEVSSVGTKPIKVSKIGVVGTERAHKAKLYF